MNWRIGSKRRVSASFFVTATLALAALLSGCAAKDNPSEQRAYRASRSKGPVVVAAASPWGQKRNLLWEGLTLARDEINASGGVINRPIELIPFDDDNDVGQGQLVAYDIAENPDVVAVIGHSSSSISIANAILYHYYGIVMVSPLSTSTNLTRKGFNKVFRNIPSDTVFGMEAAALCERKDWKKVLIYYINTAYGQDLANSFELACAEHNVEIVDRSSFEPSSSLQAYSSTAAFWLRNYDFDAVYLCGLMPQAGRIVAEFRQQGILAPIVGGEAFDHPMLFSTAGKFAEDVYVTTVFDIDSSYKPFMDFRRKFNQVYGKEPDQAACHGYDALYVLAKGIENAGTTVPDKIAEGLLAIDEWNGSVGPYRFDGNGDIADKRLIVKRVVNGAFTGDGE